MPKSVQILIVLAVAVVSMNSATAETQTVPSEPVSAEACMSCHMDTFQEWKSSKHASGKDGIGCTTCHKPHDGTTPSEPAMDPKKLCSSCHPQRAVLQGKGAKDIEETRSMHSNIACQDCHMTSGTHRMQVIHPDDPDLSEDRTDSCSPCHNIDSRDVRAAQIRDYHKFYEDGMPPLQADLKAIHTVLEKNPELLDAALKTKLDETKSNLSIIIDDGSEGFHNLPYSLEIMYLARKNLAKIKAAIE